MLTSTTGVYYYWDDATAIPAVFAFDVASDTITTSAAGLLLDGAVIGANTIEYGYGLIRISNTEFALIYRIAGGDLYYAIFSVNPATLAITVTDNNLIYTVPSAGTVSFCSIAGGDILCVWFGLIGGAPPVGVLSLYGTIAAGVLTWANGGVPTMIDSATLGNVADPIVVGKLSNTTVGAILAYGLSLTNTPCRWAAKGTLALGDVTWGTAVYVVPNCASVVVDWYIDGNTISCFGPLMGGASSPGCSWTSVDFSGATPIFDKIMIKPTPAEFGEIHLSGGCGVITTDIRAFIHSFTITSPTMDYVSKHGYLLQRHYVMGGNNITQLNEIPSATYGIAGKSLALSNKKIGRAHL
jgi:hypothetical protein